MTHHIDLETLTIKRGSHTGPEAGGCLLEWVSAWDEQPWANDPTVDPVLAAFGTIWNDSMRTNREREQLRQYIPLLGGTNHGSALSEQRAWMAIDWLVRVNTPLWLRLAGGECAVHADTLAALPPILDIDTVRRYQPAMDRAARVAETTGLAGPARDRWAAGAMRAAWAAGAMGTEVNGAVRIAWARRIVRAVRANGHVEPTITTAQASAHDLFHRMIDAR